FSGSLPLFQCVCSPPSRFQFLRAFLSCFCVVLLVLLLQGSKSSPSSPLRFQLPSISPPSPK
ncbi:hypothetical protein AVEN_176488-1, partial [Araneus ventricosus]